MAGVRRRLDIFGVLVLFFAASTSGGITRDLLIGAAPPAALEDWRYLAVSLAAGPLCLFWAYLLETLRNPVAILDNGRASCREKDGTQLVTRRVSCSVKKKT